MNAYPLTSSQLPIWLLSQNERLSLVYNNIVAYDMFGEVDYDRFSVSINVLLKRQEALRTAFIKNREGGIEQYILPYFFYKPELISYEEKEGTNLSDWINTLNDTAINLETDNLFRFILIKVEAKRFIFVAIVHHIISDGWSFNLIAKEIFQHYNGLEQSDLLLNYSDYLGGVYPVIPSGEDFWLKQFLDKNYEANPIRLDRVRAQDRTYAGNSVNFELTAQQSVELKTWLFKNKLSLFIGLVGIYYLLIHKMSNAGFVVIGAPFDQRANEDQRNLLGMFVNTVAMPIEIDHQLTINQFFKLVKDKVIDFYNHQTYPFNELVSKLKVERKVNENPLFEIMFALQDKQFEDEVDDLQVKWLLCKKKVAHFELFLQAFDLGNQLKFEMIYDKSIYDLSTINKITQYYKEIVSTVLENPNSKIAEIKFRIDQSIVKYDQEDVLINGQITLAELLEKSYAANLTRIAIRTDTKCFSYGELEAKSCQIANLLLSKGVKPNDIVAVICKRSPELIFAAHGIIRAGAAYMPLDPSLPEKWIKNVLKASGAKILMADKHYFESDIDLVLLSEDILNSVVVSPLKLINKIDDLIYVIYTSGSTGDPKGVMIEHKAIINRDLWLHEKYPIQHQDVMILKTPIMFDVSVWEIFWWVKTGSSVYILEDGLEKDPEQIMIKIKGGEVTIIHFVPSFLDLFISYVKKSDQTLFDKLKYIYSSGEALLANTVNDFNDITLGTKVRLINLYGPAETIEVSYYTCPKEKISRVPIGKPIDNFKIYIVDHHMQLLPACIEGELCVSGIGVARGYLNKIELTREKFIDNPFEEGTRLYKTGDLARWLPDGNIEYLGRIDEQVKIRGNRIELGQIENSLLDLAYVKEAAALVKEKNGEKYLVCYFTSELICDIDEIRAYLEESIPEYMIPSFFAQIDEMPRTNSGKISKKILGKKELTVSSESYYEPTNEVERQLTIIWATLLNIESGHISMSDNFFRLGGNSILLVKMRSMVEKKFDVDIAHVFLYSNSSVKKIAEKIEQLINDGRNVNDNIGITI
ncbi:non-ribosomal peptide synthetase [Pedobacter kyonggii]|uniref:Amino acid adenylation domain-containing protein n=1 Tax=Pedobacter kyonggii TaxID=1926871 RepID=A0A4Q9HH67_9SPHI|nr:non-ribosomal peptide synthetase [Pedobacter kyonggii]TBO44299.1 amino acid adenylation domain-containing protein [Pedobacter kyonggii]